MKLALVVMVLCWALLLGTAEAVIYQYTDDNGTIHYTNELSTVPTDKLNQVTESKETHSDKTSLAPIYTGPSYPLVRQSEREEAAAAKKKKWLEKKQALEAEYQRVLKEKEALDNDKAFQAKRHRRKYKYKPYIIAKVAKEAQLKKRLAELENQLKAFSK